MITFERRLLCSLFLATLLFPLGVSAQESLSPAGKDLYDRVKNVSLNGGTATVNGLTLKRDRVQMLFQSGTFYFAKPIDGRVTAAVFVGEGKFTSDVPPSEFEKDNVKRLLGAETVESDFKVAVFRFSDDTFEKLGLSPASPGTADPHAQKLLTESDGRMLKQSGASLASRITQSFLNQERPGFFFATFEGGKRGRFDFILDYQNRIPVAHFGLDGGEKGLIFAYDSTNFEYDIWMAFYGEQDYERRSVSYSDVNDQINITHYDMDVDLREHKKYVRLQERITAEAKADHQRAIAFYVGEDLSEYENWRLKKQMRVQQAKVNGVDASFSMEDWEGGFTVYLPAETSSGQKLEIELVLQGDFMYDAETVNDCHYPRSNESWFARHGHLDHATFDLTFRHPKRLKVATSGLRLSETADPEDKNTVITKYRMDQPVDLITFALAPFERHTQMVKWEKGGVGDPIPLEFNSLPGDYKAIKEDFILAELDNSLRYFTALFGKYPYSTFGAAFHPFNFGQGFPTMLMIPAADRAGRFTYVFIAHETSHQWWGDIVTWRSYRDQWLSEGFAEYSGILYTGLRSGRGDEDALISQARSALRDPPFTTNGIGKGRLVDVGPLILGHRLETRKTGGAYQALIYEKGALVLRMLHFLLSDPATGNGDAFFKMMTDFVNRYRNGFASTDDFRLVANEHFAKSPIAIKYHLNNLDWFFREWVYHTELPSYQLEYHLEDQPDGKVLLSGTVTQTDVPNDWFMVLPIMITFGPNQQGGGTAYALGPKGTFQVKLPARPTKVELDPRHWVLSEKTSTKAN